MKIICSALLIITTILTDNMNNQHSDARAAALTYLALGDSYTIGEAVPTEQSFPYLLTQQLNKGKHQVNDPAIIATTGWTTDELIEAVSKSEAVHKKFDLVTLLIGVNDQYRGLSQENYKIKFKQVLNTAINFAGGNKSHVFVLSIPDYGVTPFGKENENKTGAEIDQFNAINKLISNAAAVNYLDITGISRQAKNDPELIAADGLHPSGKMYGEWVKLLESMVAAKLGTH